MVVTEGEDKDGVFGGVDGWAVLGGAGAAGTSWEEELHGCSCSRRSKSKSGQMNLRPASEQCTTPAKQ